MTRLLFSQEHPVASRYTRAAVSVSTLARLARRTETYKSVETSCGRLASDPFNERQLALYEKGLALAGSDWGYLDLLTVLHATATILRPVRYLEIGVRRGRSCCVVASASPETEIFGCDLWQEGYAGAENPGPEFVARELDNIGHKGGRVFLSGNSRQVLPELFEREPELRFDLINVDGDHSVKGAWKDLEIVVPRLVVGGVLVFDDCANPYCPGLDKVWMKFLRKHPELQGYMYTELPPGIGFALKMCEAGS